MSQWGWKYYKNGLTLRPRGRPRRFISPSGFVRNNRVETKYVAETLVRVLSLKCSVPGQWQIIPDQYKIKPYGVE